MTVDAKPPEWMAELPTARGAAAQALFARGLHEVRSAILHSMYALSGIAEQVETLARHVPRPVTTRSQPVQSSPRAVVRPTVHVAPDEGGLLTSRAAAQRLGLSTATLAKWRCVGGDGPPYRKLGSRVFYATDDVEAWVDSHGLRRSTSHNVGPR